MNGDARNLEYGSTYGAPSFSRLPLRVALGSKSTVESIVSRDAPTDRGRRPISKQIIPDLICRRVRRASPESDPDRLDDGRIDYIPLRRRKLQKRKHEDWTKKNGYPPNVECRIQSLIEDKAESTSFSHGDIVDFTDDSESDGKDTRTIVLEERLQRKRAALSSKVEQDPTDWHAWIALVALQDERDGLHDDTSELRRTNAERQSDAEIALAIYDKALKTVTDPEGRKHLYLDLMPKVPEIWDRGKVLAKWQLILKEYPSSHELWKSYLDFHQSVFSGFSLDQTREHYLNCLGMVRGAREHPGQEQKKQSDMYNIQIYILLRMTLLLREGGYTEIAVAMWQALLEFAFNAPPHLCQKSQQQAVGSRHDELLSAFEQFWDSEVPRIGELNAKGWLNFKSDDSLQEPLSRSIESPFPADNKALESWVSAERKAASNCDTPSRAIDETSGDPYRVVLFSDIKPALTHSPTPSEAHTILSAFLCFCCLPPYQNALDPVTNSWYNDQYVRNDLIYYQSISVAFQLGSPGNFMPTYDIRDQSVPCHDTPGQYLPSPLAFPLVEHQISTDTLFSTPGRWFSTFGAWSWGPAAVPKELILTTVKSLVDRGVGGDDLAEYLLALELQLSPATVAKSAKSLLKTRQSSLRLYNAYALIQYQLGNAEGANTVINTAIQMSTKLNEIARRDVILLWRSRLWFHFSAGQTTTALEQLLNLGVDNLPTRKLEDEGKATNTSSATATLRLRNVSPS